MGVAPWVALAISVALTGCGARSGSAAEAAPREPAPWLLAAPAHARLALFMEPRRLLRHAGARELWEAFVDPQRERRFVERSGMDPRDLFELMFVEYPQPDRFVLLTRGPFDAERAVREAGERLAVVDVRADAPELRREGLRGEGRWAYWALAPDLWLTARDTPPRQLSDFVHRFRTGDHALPASVRELVLAYRDQPLVLLVPTPLSLPGDSGAALLLAQQQALALVLSPEDTSFHVTVDLRGTFPPGARDNFLSLLRSLATTELGRALGLEAALSTLRIRVDDRGVRLRFDVGASVLVRGLSLLFSQELPELFE